LIFLEDSIPLDIPSGELLSFLDVEVEEQEKRMTNTKRVNK